MIVYVILTNGKSVQTRYERIERSNNTIDTIIKFQKDEVVRYE